MFQLLFSVLIFERSCTIHLSGVPVVVGVTIFILSFSSVSESAMVFNRHTTCYVNFPSKLTKEFPPNVTTHRLRMSHLPSFAKLLQLLSQSGQLSKILSDRLDPSKKFKRTLKKETHHIVPYTLNMHKCLYM